MFHFLMDLLSLFFLAPCIATTTSAIATAADSLTFAVIPSSSNTGQFITDASLSSPMLFETSSSPIPSTITSAPTNSLTVEEDSTNISAPPSDHN